MLQLYANSRRAKVGGSYFQIIVVRKVKNGKAVKIKLKAFSWMATHLTKNTYMGTIVKGAALGLQLL